MTESCPQSISQGHPGLGLLGVGLVVACFLWSFKRRHTVKQESLLVIQELGVQITTKYVDGRETSKFLDKAKTRRFFNEGITMHRVVFYMAFIVEGQGNMVVAFENLKPRLGVLVKIYR
ncbi:unnamed protein product [Choristocarpus tenellus]